ncbi:MAG: hypothetical protein AMXMBFR58_03300 [Phycisphaerae bacterium]
MWYERGAPRGHTTTRPCDWSSHVSGPTNSGNQGGNKGCNPRPPNGPATTGNPSGGGRGNNPPKK